MRGTGKKARHQESRKSSLSNKESGSILIASLKKKKGNKKISRGDKRNSGSKSRNKLSKKMFADPSSIGKLIHRKRSLIVGARGNGQGANEDGLIGKLKNRKNKRRKGSKVELDEPLRLQRRTRYLMIKMKLEQNLIDAYSGEGWKGQSREKIKPEKELIRAKKQILKCKLGLRDAIRQLDNLSTVGCIEDSVIAPDGSVSHEHIFCAKCKLNEVLPDNDIILCDGTCNCAFHQKCLDPPLDTENIPPGDQGWFCKFCECRMDIIEAMNAHLGTHFSVESNWQDIFQQEAAYPDGGSMLLNPEEEWPSDDSEDDDYDPERRENISGAGTDDDASDDGTSTSLGWSSDNEVSSETRRWQVEGRDLGNPSIYSSLDSGETSDGEVMYGRRQRRAVDYKKLYDEMFGKDATAHEQVSEDEDWGPAKRRRREKESDAADTLMTLYESKKTGKETEAMDLERKLPRDPRSRRQCYRLPPDAVEKLRQVFAENELPSRPVKENLSKELGLEPHTVGKWFKNARYLALKSRKAGKATRHYSRAKISGECRLDTVNNKTTSKDSSLETGSASPENLRKVIRRKKPKSIMGAKTNELKRGSPGSPAKFNEANGEHSDDVSLNELLKAKTKRGRSRVDSDSTEASLAAEAELERICGAKVRLDNMKQTLMKLQLHNGKARNSNRRTHLSEESVIYVPIAELREKF